MFEIANKKACKTRKILLIFLAGAFGHNLWHWQHVTKSPAKTIWKYNISIKIIFPFLQVKYDMENIKKKSVKLVYSNCFTWIKDETTVRSTPLRGTFLSKILHPPNVIPAAILQKAEAPIFISDLWSSKFVVSPIVVDS